MASEEASLFVPIEVVISNTGIESLLAEIRVCLKIEPSALTPDEVKEVLGDYAEWQSRCRHMHIEKLAIGSTLSGSSSQMREYESPLEEIRKTMEYSEKLPSRIGAAFVCPPHVEGMVTYCDMFLGDENDEDAGKLKPGGKYMHMYEVEFVKDRNGRLPKIHVTNADLYKRFQRALDQDMRLGQPVDEDTKKLAKMYWSPNQDIMEMGHVEIIVSPPECVRVKREI